MARGFADLWNIQTAEIKANSKYKENFDLFAAAVSNTQFRLDLETNQAAKISKILNDEVEFTKIVNDEYLGRLQNENTTK